jgi:hypothetical protein
MKKLVNGELVAMTPAEITALEAARASVTSVPQEVTMRQARLALMAAGKLGAVEDAINALPEPAKTAARIEWEYSQSVQRSRGIVAQLGAAIGLTSAQVDALFIDAAQR